MDRSTYGSLLALAAAALLVLAGFCTDGLAQSASVTVNGGNLNLAFTTPAAGSDFSDVVDNTSCSLSWYRPAGAGNNRITVQTSIAVFIANLTVEAINISGGQSQGPITLSTTAQNFVLGVMTGNGGCDLEYTASVSLTDGTGSDVHTVIFTITS